MPSSATSTPARLRLAALVILVVGLLAATAVYLSAADERKHDALGDATLASLDDAARREMQQVERLGGKATVMTVQFNQWLASLWHGERLAATLAVLSVLVALGCRGIADLMDEPSDDH